MQDACSRCKAQGRTGAARSRVYGSLLPERLMNGYGMPVRPDV